MVWHLCKIFKSSKTSSDNKRGCLLTLRQSLYTFLVFDILNFSNYIQDVGKISIGKAMAVSKEGKGKIRILPLWEICLSKFPVIKIFVCHRESDPIRFSKSEKPKLSSFGSMEDLLRQIFFYFFHSTTHIGILTRSVNAVLQLISCTSRPPS